MSVEFIVTLKRSLAKRTNPLKIKSQIQHLGRKALLSSRGAGFDYRIIEENDPDYDHTTGLWKFTRKVKFVAPKPPRDLEAKKRKIIEVLMKAGQRQPFDKTPWQVEGEEAIYNDLTVVGQVSPIAREGKEPKPVKDIRQINTDPGHHFDHIYEREHQLKIIFSALKAAKESNFENRFHCVLYGKPGTAKTDLLVSLGKMLGEENEDYLSLDGTSTTEAGIRRILLEADVVPPVLVIQEAEKCEEKALRWLLGVLDHTGRIQRTNYHVGNEARSVRMLCFATVNDIELFKKVASGALHSRFAHEIHCPRPDRALMARILQREVEKINGDTAWIEPTLKFCFDIMKITDVRKIVPVCLCGREQLLDGSYQRSILHTLDPDIKYSVDEVELQKLFAKR